MSDNHNIDSEDFDLSGYLLVLERECAEEDLDNELRDMSEDEVDFIRGRL